jgi:hypothetical protein
VTHPLAVFPRPISFRTFSSHTLCPLLPVTCDSLSMLQSRVIAALRSHALRRSYSSIGVFPDLVKDKAVQLTNSRGVNVIHDPLLSKGTDGIPALNPLFTKYSSHFLSQAQRSALPSESVYLSVASCLPGARKWTSSWPVSRPTLMPAKHRCLNLCS